MAHRILIFFNCHGCRLFIWCEKHWYLGAPFFKHNNSFIATVEWQKWKYNLNFCNLYINIQMRLYRDFDFIVQELNYLSSSIFLIFYITGSIKRKKEKWCIYYWVIISIKKFVINRAFQEFCLICQKDKGQLHKSERLKVCVVKKKTGWFGRGII